MTHLTQAQYLEIDEILDRSWRLDGERITPSVLKQLTVVLKWKDPWHPPAKKLSSSEEHQT